MAVLWRPLQKYKVPSRQMNSENNAIRAIRANPEIKEDTEQIESTKVGLSFALLLAVRGILF